MTRHIAIRLRRSFALGLLLVAASAAVAADSPRLKELKKRYDELSRNHDDEATRARRLVLLDLFEVREEKGARSLLKKALDDERHVDNRVAVVHVLGGCGEPKDVGKLFSGLKKERHRAPVLALGRGLGFTPDAAAADVTTTVLKALKKAKEDLRPALLEGLGGLGRAEAVPALLAFKTKTRFEMFERNLALGRCGGSEALAALQLEFTSADPAARLGAIRGLAAMGGDDAFETLGVALLETDERLVRAAAAALAEAGRKESAVAVAKALANAQTLRTREALRDALKVLVGGDFGHDAAAWQAAAGGQPPKPGDLPVLPMFYGTPVASDAVLILLDTSRSVEWMGRLAREIEGCREFLGTVPAAGSFAIWDVSRTTESFANGFAGVGANRKSADTWLTERLSRRSGCDLKSALVKAVEDLPGLDTIVIATDSHPWGTGSEESSLETLETFRHINRVHDIRLVVALVMPGGRYEPSERSEPEIEERIEFLRQLAEESGGVFVHVK